jgi:hypothetical protein
VVLDLRSLEVRQSGGRVRHEWKQARINWNPEGQTTTPEDKIESVRTNWNLTTVV